MKVMLIMPSRGGSPVAASSVAAARLSPPLGLASLAAGLRMAGHAPVLLDGPARGLPTTAVARAVKKERPGLVGIPCYTVGRNDAYAAAASIKEALPNAPIVMGGPHVTYLPHAVLDECPSADLVLCGEAEFTLADLATRLESGSTYCDIPGIGYRDLDGRPILAPLQWESDIDRYPIPARDVFEPGLYNPVPLSVTCAPTPMADVMASRGCSWGRCRYCTSCSDRAAPYRRRSVEHVMKELGDLVMRDHVRLIFFRDDNLTNDHRWLTALCNLLGHEGLGVKWLSNARVDTVTPSLLKRMAAAGCINLIYGFESGNQETLNLIRKGTTLDQARKAVQWTHEAGIEIHGNWMIGFPGETPAMAEKTFQFAAELNAEFFEVFAYQVIPETPLAELAQREGKIDYDSASMLSAHYVPKGYENAGQLEVLMQSFLRRYYLRPRYVAGALWRARNPKVLADYIRKSRIVLRGQQRLKE